MKNWDKKTTTSQTWNKLKKFIANKYAKLKLKADEHSAHVSGDGMTASIKENPTIKDYTMATREMLAAVTQASNKKYKEMLA